jgi:hypothetical protein
MKTVAQIKPRSPELLKQELLKIGSGYPGKGTALQLQPLSFEDVCALEPRLAPLYEDATHVMDDGSKGSFCANRAWAGIELDPQGRLLRSDGGLQSRLSDLVGRRRKDDAPWLASSFVFDICRRTIYEALPDCRNCSCLGFTEIVNARIAEAKLWERPRGTA